MRVALANCHRQVVGGAESYIKAVALELESAGHELALPLFDDAVAVIDEHFWHEQEGASVEDHDRDWRPLEDYRGANSNMHLCEALLAASEVSGDPGLAERYADSTSSQHRVL